jgi:hypothetical protein
MMVQFRDTYGLNKIKDIKIREVSYNRVAADLIDFKMVLIQCVGKYCSEKQHGYY